MSIYNQLLLILASIIYLYFIIISIRYPIVPAAIYPLTFIISTQTLFSIGGLSPSKYIGVVLIFAGIISLFKETKSSSKRNYSLLGLFFLIMLFPVWIFIRFLIEGSAIDIALTFMLNAITVFSIVIIVINNKKRKIIMEISLSVTFFIVSLGMIIAYYFPSNAIFISNQSSLTQLGEYIRTRGLINDPNLGGAFITIGIMYFLSKLIYSYETKRKRQIYLFLILIIISVISLLFTDSRAAILSLIVCLPMMVLLGRMKFKNIVWLLPLMIILYAIIYKEFPAVIKSIVYRFSISTIDLSNIRRIAIFRQGIDVVNKNILVGVGNSSGYHNTFIDVTAFGGAIAFILFALIIIMVIVMNIKIMTSTKPELQETARFVIFGLLVFVVNGIFVGMEGERIVWFLFGWGMINYIFYRKAQRVAKTMPGLNLNLQSNLQ